MHMTVASGAATVGCCAVSQRLVLRRRMIHCKHSRVVKGRLRFEPAYAMLVPTTLNAASRVKHAVCTSVCTMQWHRLFLS